MNLQSIYEGALYYFDKALTFINDEKYDKAMNSITKGYKNIQDTPVNSETKAGHYTELSVGNIQNEKFKQAKSNVNQIILIIELWLTSNIRNKTNSI